MNFDMRKVRPHITTNLIWFNADNIQTIIRNYIKFKINQNLIEIKITFHWCFMVFYFIFLKKTKTLYQHVFKL